MKQFDFKEVSKDLPLYVLHIQNLLRKGDLISIREFKGIQSYKPRVTYSANASNEIVGATITFSGFIAYSFQGMEFTPYCEAIGALKVLESEKVSLDESEKDIILKILQSGTSHSQPIVSKRVTGGMQYLRSDGSEEGETLFRELFTKVLHRKLFEALLTLDQVRVVESLDGGSINLIGPGFSQYATYHDWEHRLKNTKVDVTKLFDSELLRSHPLPIECYPKRALYDFLLDELNQFKENLDEPVRSKVRWPQELYRTASHIIDFFQVSDEQVNLLFKGRFPYSEFKRLEKVKELRQTKRLLISKDFTVYQG